MTSRDPAGRALAAHHWPDVEDRGSSGLVVVPIGSLEQHGPHLPLDTDTRIAEDLSYRLVAGLAAAGSAGPDGRAIEADVAPAIPYGASGEHADFAGTVSIGTSVLTQLVIEVVRSARRSFGGVVLVSGHGGNADALDAAVRRCRYEGDRVLAAGVTVPGSDAHAGRTETSMMLALDPGAVRMAEAQCGRIEPLRDLMPALRDRGVRAVSGNGVLGDPTGATAAEGRVLFETATAALVAQVQSWWSADDTGVAPDVVAPDMVAPDMVVSDRVVPDSPVAR
jgi:creatinine amidohydrolase